MMKFLTTILIFGIIASTLGAAVPEAKSSADDLQTAQSYGFGYGLGNAGFGYGGYGLGLGYGGFGGYGGYGGYGGGLGYGGYGGGLGYGGFYGR